MGMAFTGMLQQVVGRQFRQATMLGERPVGSSRKARTMSSVMHSHRDFWSSLPSGCTSCYRWTGDSARATEADQRPAPGAAVGELSLTGPTVVNSSRRLTSCSSFTLVLAGSRADWSYRRPRPAVEHFPRLPPPPQPANKTPIPAMMMAGPSCVSPSCSTLL